MCFLSSLRNFTKWVHGIWPQSCVLSCMLSLAPINNAESNSEVPQCWVTLSDVPLRSEYILGTWPTHSLLLRNTTVLLFSNSGGTDASLPFCHCTLQFTWGVWGCVRLWCHWLPHPSYALAAASPALCFYLQNPQVQLSSFIYTYASFIVCASQSLPLQNDLEGEEYKNWGYYSMHCPRKFLTVTAFF